MPKFIYVVGLALLWLVTVMGLAWWIRTALEIYELKWAVLACVVISISVLFVAYVFQRVWQWCWIRSNTRKAMDRRLSLERCSGSKKLADDEMIHQQWRSQLKSEDQ